MSPTTTIRYTADEYLRLERLAETKSEYFDGEIVPMPGVTREHNLINGNLVFEIKGTLAAGETMGDLLLIKWTYVPR